LLPAALRSIFPGTPLLGVWMGREGDGEEGRMSLKFRAVAVVGVVVLALCGCQKGNGKASSGAPDMTEAAKADSKSGKAVMKSGGTTERRRKEGATETTASTKKESATRAGAVKSGTLTEADNEMEYDFRQGQVITVVLDSNKSSGLSWVVVEPMGSVIVPSGTGMYAARAGKTPGGKETWHFRCAKPGFQTVKMEYRRKWAQSTPERTFRFSGNVR